MRRRIVDAHGLVGSFRKVEIVEVDCGRREELKKKSCTVVVAVGLVVVDLHAICATAAAEVLRMRVKK